MTRPRKASGAQIGARTKRVWTCAKCGLQHVEIKPTQCIFCKSFEFLAFDSQGEANHWAKLKLREKIGEISNLQRQRRFGLWAAAKSPDFGGNGTHGHCKVGEYVADFTFTDCTGKLHIQDYKPGVMTDLADFKLRFMAAMGKPVEIVGG